jgi:hypothetical protein
VNGYKILKENSENEKVCILHSSLTKEKAINILAKSKNEDEFSVANTLHFRLGKSLIDRSDFDELRKSYWQQRAIEIENGNFTKILPKCIIPTPLFPSDELDSERTSSL